MSKARIQLPRNIRRASLFFKLFNSEHLAHIPMGILLFFGFVTLTIMVSFPALISVERNETTLTRLLADKGFSLITAFENVLRTGMRSQMGIRLQFLLEQMTQSPDVNFIAVTMPDGTIIAHTDRRSGAGASWKSRGQEALWCTATSSPLPQTEAEGQERPTEPEAICTDSTWKEEGQGTAWGADAAWADALPVASFPCP